MTSVLSEITDTTYGDNHGTVKVVVRKMNHLSHHFVDRIEIDLRNRMPNCKNVVIHNLDRTIKDLQEIRNDIVDARLYNDETYSNPYEVKKCV